MSALTDTKRLAFVTIGQTPRSDLVPEMVSWIGERARIVEFGALDGLDPSQIAALAPGESEERLVTRLLDGSEAVISRARVQERLDVLLARLAREEFFALVLLCTGSFPGLQVEGLVLHAQAIVDHGVTALGAGARSLGVMLPHVEQLGAFHFRPRAGQELILAHASPYSPHRLDQAARELSPADLLVMHCMGYTEEMRCRVAQLSGRPVLLARRMVAAAVEQLL